MSYAEIISWVGIAAALVMPLFNIPLIIKIVKRKSSADISMSWVLGVWICALLMAPAGVTSKDIQWQVFNVVNLVLFTCVVIVVLKYRKGPHAQKGD